jgi:hypothetical protein
MNLFRILALAALCTTLILLSKAFADVIVSWDWNDGTTQGWTASKSQSNEMNKFRAENVGNGSLQIFGPVLPASTLVGLSTVSFDLSILAYSTVASPSQLAHAVLDLQGPIPMSTPAREWTLDLSNLAFGQTRTFNLSINSASGTGSLANELFFSLLFADASFSSNTSSALLDNFVVSGTVPEPSTILLVASGALSLWPICRRSWTKTQRMCRNRPGHDRSQGN